MNSLTILEQKITALISSKKEDLATIAKLKKEITLFDEKNRELKSNIEKLENSLLTKNENVTELDQIKKDTKATVDELIKNIDLLLKDGSQL